MRAQGVVRHQLAGDLIGQLGRQASTGVDGGQLGPLGVGIGGQLAPFAGQVGPLGVGLGAHGDILAGRHGEGAGHQAGQGGEQDRPAGGLGRGHADDQAAGRDQAVIGAQDRGAQPADVGGAMTLSVSHAKR